MTILGDPGADKQGGKKIKQAKLVHVKLLDGRESSWAPELV